MAARRVLASLVALVVLSACSVDMDRSGAKPAAPEDPTVLGLPFSSNGEDGDAFAEEPFADELFTEHSIVAQMADPELFYVAGATDMRYTHVENLERRSWVGGEDGPDVWFFGGSSLFGTGQRDEHTIPSELARLASEAGTPIVAHNFGFPSYVVWQEVGLLRRLLAERPPPDLIVFLHGINDMSQVCRHLALGIEPGSHTSPQGDPPLPAVAKEDCFADAEASGQVTAQVVQSAMEPVRDLVGAVPVLEFWQPVAATRAPHPSDTWLLDRLGTTRENLAAQKALYLSTLSELGPDVIDLTDVLDDYEGPLFFDWAHTNERGARMVARAMWDRGLADATRDVSS